MASMGSLTGVFTGDLVFDWHPEPIIVANEILALSGALNNLEPPLQAARAIAEHNIDQHFDTKSGPDGEQWPEWSESYEPYATRMGGSLLEQTGELRAATKGSLEVVGGFGSGEVVISGILPHYGAAHHTGLAGRTTKWGTPNPLPARPFLGIDEEAQVEIITEFDAWFSAVVGGFGGGGGIIEQRMSKVSVFTHRTGRQQYRIGGWWGPNVPNV